MPPATGDGEPLLRPDGNRPSVGGDVMTRKDDDVPEGYTVIYRPWITLRNGKKLYASAFGHSAWRLVVRSR